MSSTVACVVARHATREFSVGGHVGGRECLQPNQRLSPHAREYLREYDPMVHTYSSQPWAIARCFQMACITLNSFTRATQLSAALRRVAWLSGVSPPTTTALCGIYKAQTCWREALTDERAHSICAAADSANATCA